MKRLMLLAPLALMACQTTTADPARVLYPVEQCGYENEPIYGVLDRPASTGEIVGGAVIGGVIGNQITNDPAGTIVGAIIGGAVTNQRRQEQVVVGSKKVYRCRTVYR
jgi:hypothetical protein